MPISAGYNLIHPCLEEKALQSSSLLCRLDVTLGVLELRCQLLSVSAYFYLDPCYWCGFSLQAFGAAVLLLTLPFPVFPPSQTEHLPLCLNMLMNFISYTHSAVMMGTGCFWNQFQDEYSGQRPLSLHVHDMQNGATVSAYITQSYLIS